MDQPTVSLQHCNRCGQEVPITLKARSQVFGFWRGQHLCPPCIHERLVIAAETLALR